MVSQLYNYQKEAFAKAYSDWRESLGPFRKRLSSHLRDLQKIGMSEAKAKYWNSTVEVFARTFERYVQRKLHNAGRENTYLTGLRKEGHPLWPTNEEVDAMAPHFDAIFKAFGASKEIVRHFMETVDNVRRYSREECAEIASRYAKEEGHWVTVHSDSGQGQHVFISKGGELRPGGPKSHAAPEHVGSKSGKAETPKVPECPRIVDLLRYEWNPALHPRDRKTGVFIDSRGGASGAAGSGGAAPTSHTVFGGGGEPAYPDDSAKPIDPRGGDKPEAITPSYPTTMQLPQAGQTQVQSHTTMQPPAMPSQPPAPAPGAVGEGQSPPEAPSGPGAPSKPGKGNLEARRAKLQEKAKSNELAFNNMTPEEQQAHKAERDAKAAVHNARNSGNPGLLQQLMANWKSAKQAVGGLKKKALARANQPAATAAFQTAPDAPQQPQEPEGGNLFAGWHEQTMEDRWNRHKRGGVYQANSSPHRYSLDECRRLAAGDPPQRDDPETARRLLQSYSTGRLVEEAKKRGYRRLGLDRMTREELLALLVGSQRRYSLDQCRELVRSM